MPRERESAWSSEPDRDDTAVVTTGSQFGPYAILGALGQGGMGAVYRARDTRLERVVAIKVLLDRWSLDPEHVARFEREARLLASLTHPHIATLYGLEDAAGQQCLVMELVEGDTLAERMNRGALPVPEALQIAAQIAAALDAAHEHGIVHRDLKPANIKVTPDGIVKVLDFGLAKVIGATGERDEAADLTVTSDGTRVGVVLGTAAYMSPEQARGLPVDKRTDIWAFGCVLFEMLTGRRPFTGKTIPDVVSAVLQRDPDWDALPASTPPAVRRLLRRCLERDLRRRLHTIAHARLRRREPVERIAMIHSAEANVANETLFIDGQRLVWACDSEPSSRQRLRRVLGTLPARRDKGIRAAYPFFFPVNVAPPKSPKAISPFIVSPSTVAVKVTGTAFPSIVAVKPKVIRVPLTVPVTGCSPKNCDEYVPVIVSPSCLNVTSGVPVP
jgi:serine/threonine protein kinase